MFTASYDTTTKIISGGALVLFLVIVVATHSVAVGGLFAAIVVGAYAWSPRGYAVSDGCIEVSRLIGSARIPLDGLREARAATKDDFRGCLRLFGNGGLFGYYGLFRTSKLGKSTWYVTNRGKAVVVVTGEKTALFSPDDVEGFIAAIGAPTPVRGGLCDSRRREPGRHAGWSRYWNRGACDTGVRLLVLTRPSELYLDSGSIDHSRQILSSHAESNQRGCRAHPGY